MSITVPKMFTPSCPSNPSRPSKPSKPGGPSGPSQEMINKENNTPSANVIFFMIVIFNCLCLDVFCHMKMVLDIML